MEAGIERRTALHLCWIVAALNSTYSGGDDMRSNKWLIAAGALSAIAAPLHVAIIINGPDWYRFFGAGEAMARAAERGSARPAVITIGIAAILAV